MASEHTSLVIMAAGIGSRFGGGIKQLEPVGPNGEIIMDYSIHHAVEAGFDRIVFIIRKDLEKDFREIIGNRMEKKYNIAYAFQELDDLPEGFARPKDRTKPWGTGQAVLSCKGIVKEPFAVINADDYYGSEAFVKVHDYLAGRTEGMPGGVHDICMAGFILKNTLSDNGGVTRGVCRTDENGMLTGIEETSNIIKDGDDAAVENSDGSRSPLDGNSCVSMNMWGLMPEFLDELERGFKDFLAGIPEGDLKAEYLLPTIIGKLLEEKRAAVKVLESHDKWFGVTYKEDKETVVRSFKELIASGKLPARL